MNEILNRLDKIFSGLFIDSFPGFSKKTSELIVGVIPWLVLVLALLAIPGMLTVFGAGAVATPVALIFGRSVGWFWLSWVVGGVQLVLEVVALPGLFRRQMRSWTLLYYSNLLGAAMSIVGLSVVGFLISMAIMYVIYQIRSLYK